MEDIKIDLPVCNQYDATHDNNWAHRICAICSLWMLLKLHDSNFSMPVMNLMQLALDKGGYMENIGWKHWVISSLAQEHGLPLVYARNFFYTPEEKEKGLLIIDKNIQNRQPVIISIFSHFTPARGGHMVVIHGYQRFRDQSVGYYVQDPDASFRGHNYFVTREEILANWRGGLIYREFPEQDKA